MIIIMLRIMIAIIKIIIKKNKEGRKEGLCTVLVDHDNNNYAGTSHKMINPETSTSA